MSQSKLFSNFVSVGAVQLTNFVIPILIYPYLFRTLGATPFGTVMYALNIMLYLSAFIDYGFNITAPRNIAVNQGDIRVISVVVSSVIQTKVTIFLFSSLFFACLVFLIPRLSQEVFLYLFGSIYMLGNALIPTWLFQGLEDMKHLTWINLVAKIVSILLVIIVINEPSQYVYTVGLLGLANLVSGIIGLGYAKVKYNIVLQLQPISTIYGELKTGWYYFTSLIAATLFSNTTILILGLFVTDDIVGKYGIAEKISFAVWQLIGVFSQVTYPVLCRLAQISHFESLKFIRKYYPPFIALVSTICFGLFIFSDNIIYIISGSYQEDTSSLIKILSFLPLAICLNVPAYQLLLAYGKQRDNALIFNWSAALSIGLTMLMVFLFGAIGAAWAAVITQIGVTLALHLILHKRHTSFSIW
ncbi:oligosaccharide flippase family protein [Rudanella lutea]|uniref:oligosaccharide flippase family protein n=1 Tax=Rudanella lutea TaxID=451374 RepID=UPI0003A951FF|nr:oligosaccharide flippase family protein [Rudanella lutea]